jgi:hypothetical protein
LLAEAGLLKSKSKLISTQNTMDFDFNLNLSMCSRLSKGLVVSEFSEKARNVISAFEKIKSRGCSNNKMQIKFLVHDVDIESDFMIENCVKSYVTTFEQVS